MALPAGADLGNHLELKRKCAEMGLDDSPGSLSVLRQRIVDAGPAPSGAQRHAQLEPVLPADRVENDRPVERDLGGPYSPADEPEARVSPRIV